MPMIELISLMHQLKNHIDACGISGELSPLQQHTARWCCITRTNIDRIIAESPGLRSNAVIKNLSDDIAKAMIFLSLRM